jgi:hypothetical protein
VKEEQVVCARRASIWQAGYARQNGEGKNHTGLQGVVVGPIKHVFSAYSNCMHAATHIWKCVLVGARFAACLLCLSPPYRNQMMRNIF